MAEDLGPCPICGRPMLAARYGMPESPRDQPEIVKFVRWIRRKYPEWDGVGADH